MDEEEKKLHGNSDAELPLPKEARTGSSGPKKSAKSHQSAAADLIRKKIEAAYAQEPSATHESYDLGSLTVPSKKSKHQKYIYKLTNSGKSLAEIQEAWHDYYQGLPDEQKHEVWQEFYTAHAKASKHTVHDAGRAGTGQPLDDKPPKRIVAASQRPLPPRNSTQKAVRDLRDYAASKVNRVREVKPPHHVQSLLFGLGVGCLVLLLFMFSFFNERFIAPFIQPSRNITNTPIITEGLAVGGEPEVLIPKINVEIPVVYGVDSIDEKDIQTALENGVVHYANTAKPGENGNVVVVGHSSNNIFNKGKYKFAFVLLSRLEAGDTFYLQKDGKRYTYQIYKKAIVSPSDVSVLSQTERPATATLITCDPPGSTANRLIVVGEQISPDPNSNLASSADTSLATKTAIIPGNAPSLWSRFVNWFTNS